MVVEVGGKARKNSRRRAAVKCEGETREQIGARRPTDQKVIDSAIVNRICCRWESEREGHPSVRVERWVAARETWRLFLTLLSYRDQVSS